MSIFKTNFISKKEDIDNNFVSKINIYCPNFSHEHRKASKDEYTQNKLYKLNDTGCYICNPKIYLDSYLLSISWNCPKFINKIHHKLSLNQKLMFFMITKLESKYFLPIELILIIFKMCEWTETLTKINKITPELCVHSKQCRSCAENIVITNTGFTCSHHIIPRMAINGEEI